MNGLGTLSRCRIRITAFAVALVFFAGQALLPAAAFAAAAQTQATQAAPKPAAPATAAAQEKGEINLALVVGQSQILKTDLLDRVAVADPKIADVLVVSDREVLVTGKAEGVTSLHVWDRGGRTTYKVRVFVDRESLCKEIVSIIELPGISVRVANETILLEGRVKTAGDASRAEKIARAYSDKVLNLLEIEEKAEPVPIAQVISDAIGLSTVKVTVVGNTALLEGQVEDENQAVRAEKIASLYVEKVVSLLMWPEPPAPEPEPEPEPAPAPEPPKPSPEEMANAKAAEALETIGIPGITIKVVEGKAILEGTVTNESEYYRAETIAAAYFDSVINLLEIPKPPEVPKESIDQVIAAHINDPNVKVTLARDKVLLEGKVRDEAEKARIGTIASLYADNVVNLLEAPPPSPAAVVPKDEEIRKAIGIPGVAVRMAGNSVILEGRVETQDDLSRAEKIAGLFAEKVVNFLEVEDPYQVLLQVQIVEVTHSGLKDLGLEWGANVRGVLDPGALSFGEVAIGSGFERLTSILAKLQALENAGKATVLAAPSLVASSRNPAKLLIGGEIPVYMGSSDQEIKLQWKPYGVVLEILPVVDRLGNVTLTLKPEVSRLDWENALPVESWKIPALSTRRADTVVTVKDGTTVVIGGLLQSEDSKHVEKLPILGDLPIIGRLFRSESYKNGTTELLIFVTPTVTRINSPADPGKVVNPAVPYEMRQEVGGGRG